ncbi:MAG TPA: hypothetical protein VIQ99_00625, partial [Gammaproteobacteria bacterium]
MILRFALALGVTGFVAGFFGPIALNPEANQGPLLGIFITGPLGALAGLALGTLFRFLPVTDAFRHRALALLCAALGIGTLYACLPEPAVRGHVIEAHLEACASPAQAFATSLAEWEDAVERVTWATPPANWKDTARRNVERDTGAVVTMRVTRRASIYEHRKPWNSGRKTAGPWVTVDEAERYYVGDAGTACAAYAARGRELYTPFSDSTYDS